MNSQETNEPRAVVDIHGEFVPTSPATIHCAEVSGQGENLAGVEWNVPLKNVGPLDAAAIKRQVSELDEMLRWHGLDTSTWGTAPGSRDVETLYWEYNELKQCVLSDREKQGKIKRVVRLAKIRILADIFGVEHTLYSRLQVTTTGERNARKQVPLRRLCWKEPSAEELSSTNSLMYAPDCPYTEDWVRACSRALTDRLNISFEWQSEQLEEDIHAHCFRIEDDVISPTYPGLKTLYAVHEVIFRVSNPLSPGTRCIGLPSGQEFATTDGNFDVTLRESSAEHTGSQLNLWTWERNSNDGKGSPIKRVPLPTLSSHVLGSLWARAKTPSFEPPSVVLRLAQEGRVTDWDTVKRMSSRIAEPNYSLTEFYNDLAAFPELDLYLLDGDVVPNALKSLSGCQSASASSGRDIGDEYQRTVGTFFAIYWLLRLGVDGKEGFCFGVDEQYKPIKPDAGEERLYPAEKRVKFFKESPWDQFENLLIDAGLLVKEKRGCNINHKRVATVLALTAIHDVMKVQKLLPTVAPHHKTYHGYKSGDLIGDHDHALSYVMDYFPDLLPSFAGLPADEQHAVQFTQCEIQFNHGWLVQAEAPPGAIFTKFRQVLNKSKRATAKDVALYFVHWLTDLAGAEPTPLAGCEKFVVKFPLPVLVSFLRSFKIVQTIASKTETQVFESYLKMRWEEYVPPLGPMPTGPGGIAQMRLLCMSQMSSGPILEAYEKLPAADREVLHTEMSLTACEKQSYSANLVPKEKPSGPAFLIYYGPAFLQSLGSDDAVKRLQVLVEVYRGARKLWPASSSSCGSWVTVRVDPIKALSVAEICEAGLLQRWLLLRANDSEAFIEQEDEKDQSRKADKKRVCKVYELEFGSRLGWQHIEKEEVEEQDDPEVSALASRRPSLGAATGVAADFAQKIFRSNV